MNQIILPNRIDRRAPGHLPSSRQITIIGASGSGKSRFMAEMISRCGDRAYLLSAISAFYPESSQNPMPGSIDALYNEATSSDMRLRNDAVTELDKVIYLLLNDEFRYLISAKAQKLLDHSDIRLEPTRLDKLVNLWERIFPGNQILNHAGQLQFTTESGDNQITTMRLSSGEKAVLYYIAAALYAMPNAVIFIDSPSMFLHPSMLNTLWNSIEELRPDCTFVYDTNSVDFVNSRTENICVWIKRYDAQEPAWDYEVLAGDKLTDDLFIDLIGTRKPVLFIEGDAVHSIDAKLYPLVFPEYTVRPLGSCNKVIESTRTFNDLRPLHQLESRGIVDRDRRTDHEVDYLRRKDIMVPDAAEIENIFLLEGVIRPMARRRGKDPDKIIAKVKASVMAEFTNRLEEQALMHVRHKMKRDVECKIDARVNSIEAFEEHLHQLVGKLAPRDYYRIIKGEFKCMIAEDDYASVLKVFNHKPMLSQSGLAQMLGYPNRDAYIAGVLGVLKGNGRDAALIRGSIKYCFGITGEHTTTSDVVTKVDDKSTRKKNK